MCAACTRSGQATLHAGLVNLGSSNCGAFQTSRRSSWAATCSACVSISGARDGRGCDWPCKPSSSSSAYFHRARGPNCKMTGNVGGAITSHTALFMHAFTKAVRHTSLITTSLLPLSAHSSCHSTFLLAHVPARWSVSERRRRNSKTAPWPLFFVHSLSASRCVCVFLCIRLRSRSRAGDMRY